MPQSLLLKSLLCVSIIFYATPSLAQISPVDQQRAIDTLQKNQQKQDNLSEYLSREYKRKQREKEKAPIEVPILEDSKVTGSQCFDINTIILTGADSISYRERRRLTTTHVNSCMDISAINQLMRDITNYYFDKGYVTTRVAIPQQSLKDGLLELLVVEGKIEDIILNENTQRDRLQVKTAFPFLKGKILNLRDIEQGLDQLNRLISANATMRLEPGSKSGYSTIIITNMPEKQNRISIGFNNSGQSSTGKNKGTLSLERDNLFGFGASLNFSYNQDTADDGRQQGSEILSTQLSIPFGYWTLSGNASHSEYKTQIIGTNETLGASGSTDSGSFTLNRVLHRDQNSKTSASVGFIHTNTIAFIENSEAETGTRALSIAKLSVDRTHRAWGSIFYGSLGYERGLDALGARQDTDGLTYLHPRAQFNKFTFDASIYKPFVVKEQNFVYRMLASGQYSSDPLFSSEQINIGDRYTVRGFQNESISGDAGGYIRNEIMWNLPKISDNSYVHNVIGGLQPYVSLDGGWTRVRGGKLNDPTGEAYISGWAVGLRNTSEWLNFDVAYAKQIKTPGFFTGEDDELYFSVSARVEF